MKGSAPVLIVAALAAGSAARAQDEGLAADVAGLRLATCAAFWQGYADVLGDDGERALAAKFRDEAIRLAGEAEAVALIEERRPWMRDLMVAYIHHQDDQSRDLFERLVTDCGGISADLPAADR